MKPPTSPAAAAADVLGLAYELTPIPRVRSLEEAVRAMGVSPAQIVKTLVVRVAESDYRFVLVPGDRQISWPVVADLAVSGRINLGAGVHGVGLMVEADEVITALAAMSADVTEKSLGRP